MIFLGSCAFTDFYLTQSQSYVTFFVTSQLLCYLGDINVYKRCFFVTRPNALLVGTYLGHVSVSIAIELS